MRLNENDRLQLEVKYEEFIKNQRFSDPVSNGNLLVQVFKMLRQGDKRFDQACKEMIEENGMEE